MVAVDATPACSGGGGGGHQRKGPAASGRGRGGGGSNSNTGEAQQRGEGSKGHRPLPPASRSTLQLGKVGERCLERSVSELEHFFFFFRFDFFLDLARESQADC